MRGTHYIIVFLGIMSVMFACSCSNDEDTEKPKELEENIGDKIILDTQNEVFKTWDEFYSKDDLTFSIDSFQLIDTIAGELYTSTANLSDTFFKCYSKLIIYNDDSSKFIDPLSYSLIVEADSKGKLHARGGEVDHEVSVVDIDKKTRTRLLFCGPSCEIQKAFWYNDQIVGIMGLSSEYSDEYFTPMIWFVNINNGITIPYEYHSNISIAEASSFLKDYVESKGIEMAD